MSVINGLSSGGNSAFSTTVDVDAGAGEPPPPPLYCLSPVVLLIVPEPPTDFNSLASYELMCANSVSPSSP